MRHGLQPYARAGLALSVLLTMGVATSTAAEPPTACSALLSPGVCYQRYLQQIARATRLADLHAFLTAERVQLLERGLARAREAGIDAAQIEQTTLQLLQRGVGTPGRIREQRFAHEASLWIDRPGLTVEVRLVIEDNRWRIADERFRETPQF